MKKMLLREMRPGPFEYNGLQFVRTADQPSDAQRAGAVQTVAVATGILSFFWGDTTVISHYGV